MSKVSCTRNLMFVAAPEAFEGWIAPTPVGGKLPSRGSAYRIDAQPPQSLRFPNGQLTSWRLWAIMPM